MWTSSRHSSSKQRNAGFTLMEILVVLGIMGILASIIFVSVNSVRVKARDQERAKDLDTIQGAVEMYYRDQGHYPITNCSTNGGVAYTAYQGTWSSKVVCKSVGAAGSNVLATELAPYIPKPLKDPGTATGDAGYLYRSDDGANYCIMIWRTPENMNNFPAKMIDMNRCGSVTSSGSCSNTGQNNIYYSSTPGATGC